ncbi:MAG: branched-chain amino acid ABC transporter permease [Chloroflexi bacterium]|nr:branched-chain amino acid ABC transporter permease [Chloroflexota bacterium]
MYKDASARNESGTALTVATKGIAVGHLRDRPPREQRTVLRHLVFAIGAVGALAVALPPSLGTPILVFSMAAIGCNLLLGTGGLLSFGQGALFGAGAYAFTLATVRGGSEPLVALLVSVAAGTAGGAFMGTISSARRGIPGVMLTFALAQLAVFSVYAFRRITGGEDGIRGVPSTLLALGPFQLNHALSTYVVSALLFTLIVVTAARLNESPLGYALKAVRDNEDRVAAIGLHVRQLKITAFAISGAITATAGAAHTLYLQSVSIDAVSVGTGIAILMISILGGSRSVAGAVLGAVVFTVLSDRLALVWSRWPMLLGIALILSAIGLRGGLWGLITDLRAWFRLRMAALRHETRVGT